MACVIQVFSVTIVIFERKAGAYLFRAHVRPPFCRKGLAWPYSNIFTSLKKIACDKHEVIVPEGQ